eukprot:g30926.t1
MSGFLLAFAWIFMWCAKAIRNRHEDEKLMPNGALDGAMESAGPSAWLEEDWNLGISYTAYMTMHASESAMMRYYAILEDDRGGFWLIANNWLPVKFPVLFDLKGSMLIDYSLIAGLLYYQLDACDGPSQAWCIAPVCHPKGGCGEAAYTLGEYFNQIKDFYCEETSVKEKQFGHTCVGGITSSLKVYFQCFGIIDLLKPFDMKSRAEYTVKAGWGRQISAQPANSYARRFDQFMVEKVFRKSWSDSTAPLVFTDQTCLDWGSIDMWGD